MEIPLLQPFNPNNNHQNHQAPDHQNYQDDPYQQEDPNQPQRIDATFAFGHSPLSNIAILSLYALKIAFAVFMCFYSSMNCASFAFYWVLAMLLHDIMATCIPIKRMKNTAALKRINENPHRPEDLNAEYIQNQLNQDLEAMDFEQRFQIQRHLHERLEDELTAYRDVLSILKRTKEIQKFSDTSLCLWMILVFGGVYFKAFQVPESCVNKEMNQVMDIYLAIAMVWLFRHVILVLVGCICLPVLVLTLWAFGGPKKASNAAIKKLPVKPYKADFPWDKECPICMVEYEEDEKVVMLACNPMHYFHEECGKKWLKINGQCPICRARVDGKKDEPNEEA